MEHIQEAGTSSESAASPVNVFPCTQRNATPTIRTSRIVKISVAFASEKHFAYSMVVVVKYSTTSLPFHYLLTLIKLLWFDVFCICIELQISNSRNAQLHGSMFSSNDGGME